LSPQLFVLAVDIIGRLFRRATELGVLRQLHPRPVLPSISLYADDVILFWHPLREEIAIARARPHSSAAPRRKWHRPSRCCFPYC
jgi:hypothetical protein